MYGCQLLERFGSSVDLGRSIVGEGMGVHIGSLFVPILAKIVNGSVTIISLKSNSVVSNFRFLRWALQSERGTELRVVSVGNERLVVQEANSSFCEVGSVAKESMFNQ
ncbi:hypothetical protein BATDEDRAFT_26832 [Batrachochytrium dendrobatidis JAM81]|uniref:Uncharacterized protein n=2 Tax=Batrachochytrium dendrobatidis TaxID=109871 RepID=F4P938_BATDJ|nr:uncharacterized protein BATDEDRAFT_26832 [Batrachochytrium dendrobatidis JAM81]EGF78274.1 hypothetical protein BATDEDRAFT_26832 [Batrachochytrium dendrobatidis JAM81]OAJ44332.1 hypothetical protein BDEG_27574 [Batrachochytrium dendrobatidis JEL423]|eukprot:XP_006681061.1 hypothetical protein BATDEDRAFT_26832 [Batrachochytrium dendrobatidis JAM81]